MSDSAPAIGSVVTLSIRVARALGAITVALRSITDGEPVVTPATRTGMDGADEMWTAQLQVTAQLMHYRWLVVGPDSYLWLRASGIVDHDCDDAHDFVIAAGERSPQWGRQGAIYQIFPDRFASSGRSYHLPEWVVPRRWDQHPEGRSVNTPREYFGGDLWGIVEKLPYLHELGVTAVYLTPFFPAGSTHRYDAVSFEMVDPLLGGDEALIALTEAAHALGMRVIGDLTLNHTGWKHEWFELGKSGVEPYRGFYTFDESLPDGYVSWLGVKQLPKLDYRSNALREQIISGPDSVIRRWLRAPFHLDGWRIDVGNMTARLGTFDANHEIARLAREAVREEGPDKMLVAEHFHDAGPDLTGDGWQGVMNYSVFTKPIWTWLRGDEFHGDWLGLPTRTPSLGALQMVSTMRAFSARMPWTTLCASWSILCSHDTARIRTVVGSRERQTAALVLLTTLPGIPMVFAGDEIGAQGEWGEDSRTPHPWADEQSWDNELLAGYRQLLHMRGESLTLAEGGLRWVHTEPDVVVFLRELGEERLLILVSRGAAQPVRIDARALNIKALEPVFGMAAQLNDDEIRIEIPSAGGGIWRLT